MSQHMLLAKKYFEEFLEPMEAFLKIGTHCIHQQCNIFDLNIKKCKSQNYPNTAVRAQLKFSLKRNKSEQNCLQPQFLQKTIYDKKLFGEKN